MIKYLEKNYMAISVTFLLLAVYVILFPFISKGIEFISPTLTECAYRKATGKNCPLCGGTRYMRGLGQVFTNPSYLLHPFGFMMMGIAFELLFRTICIYRIKKGKKLKGIIIFDIIIHVIIATLFFGYEITFVLNS